DSDVLIHALLPYVWSETGIDEILMAGTIIHPSLTEVLRGCLFNVRAKLLAEGVEMNPLARYMA
ncbi:hypothetical protein KIPB_003449, partial [Kipferlia bialata]